MANAISLKISHHNILKVKITCHLYVNKQYMYFLRVIYGSYLAVHHKMNAVIITVTIFQLICVPFEVEQHRVTWVQSKNNCLSFVMSKCIFWRHISEIILGMGSTNGRWRYNVTSSLIGWVHTQNDPCIIMIAPAILQLHAHKILNNTKP